MRRQKEKAAKLYDSVWKAIDGTTEAICGKRSESGYDLDRIPRI
jgi:hypothetical protein